MTRPNGRTVFRNARYPRWSADDRPGTLFPDGVGRYLSSTDGRNPAEFRDKRQAVDISQQVEHDISAYLVTITAMNAVVGGATAAAMYLCGLGDPLLWGAIAFLLNYIPILGPLFGTVIFLLAGMLTFDSLGWALLPPALYFGIHLVEGEALTPMLLARRFTLNPVLVILSLDEGFFLCREKDAVRLPVAHGAADADDVVVVRPDLRCGRVLRPGWCSGSGCGECPVRSWPFRCWPF